MSIILPTFTNTCCTVISACGKISEKRSIKTDVEKVAKYGRGKEQVFIRTIISGEKETHLHIDFASKDNFPDKKTPKTTHKIEDIKKTIKELFTKEIEVHITGCFKTNVNAIPASGLIRSLYTEKKRDHDVSIRLTGAKLSLSGVPVQKIEWYESRMEEGLLYITIEGESKLTIQNDYFVKLLDWMNNVYKFFVLDIRETNGKPTFSV